MIFNYNNLVYSNINMVSYINGNDNDKYIFNNIVTVGIHVGHISSSISRSYMLHGYVHGYVRTLY